MIPTTMAGVLLGSGVEEIDGIHLVKLLPLEEAVRVGLVALANGMVDIERLCYMLQTVIYRL